ncbi:MAG: hypothetical protein CEN89_358 [Candidatus Berkelbacteria bacterium Licking1014_7]|uniref:Uncharacterized protein n=1 Tax=Candidatus Berkelbacteria bacterium Licking1014_7 TaxID=2017147 RepID=A0A554LJE0_9BACT|nr:MAG: hypothetical protein CEN89_358 [Candidatus Berkelbacteria bacterium Licking1014_7]
MVQVRIFKKVVENGKMQIEQSKKNGVMSKKYYRLCLKNEGGRRPPGEGNGDQRTRACWCETLEHELVHQAGYDGARAGTPESPKIQTE